jgi:hypothetical protein
MQHRRPFLSFATLVHAAAGATLLLGASAAAPAAEPDAFYKGKTVSIYIGFAAGGSYDYFGRLVARHLGKHLPGNPTVIAEAMPGAGSFTAANNLYARAPRDGTVLGIVSQTLAIEEALGTPASNTRRQSSTGSDAPRRSMKCLSPFTPRTPRRSRTPWPAKPQWRAPVQAPLRRRISSS